ncbi:hypothetical protein CKO41_03985 [Thiococcus pfennigii]|nr:hypothetical protein [Thiococcus pfennigii]
MVTNDSQITDNRRFQPPSHAGARCVELFHERLLELFDAFYDRIEGVLLEAADKAESNGVHAGYVLATQAFRRRRRASRSAFHNALCEAMARPAAGEPTSDAAETRGDEERLALENLVSKASNRYRDTLPALTDRLARLLGDEALRPAANPVGPTAVCGALQAAIEPIGELDPPTRLVVYKLFDKQVMDRLGGLYSACLRIVAAETGRRTTNATAPTPTPRQPTTGAVAFAELQRALAHGRAPRQSGDGVATAEVVQILSGIQQTAPPGPAPASALRAQLGATLGRSLGEVDETTLDLVFLLFEHLLADNMLPDSIKVLIARLQIPILKVALLDKSFFDDPDHPARRLLNHMAQAAMGWTDDGDRSPEGLYGQLERIVERVIGDFGQDLGLFAELDSQLSAERALEDEPARIRERRVRRLAEERAEASTTAQIVAATIAARLRRYRQVPPAIRELIETGWAEVLATTHVLEGPDGSAWRAQVALVDRLLWSICPKDTQEERRELLRGVPSLLRHLRLGLADTLLDSRRIARWLRELQALQLAALRGEGPPVSPAETTPEPDDTPVAAPILVKAAPPPTGEPVRLAPGTWLALRRDDAEHVRLKVIWRAQDGTRHLFIDGKGRRTVELDRERLATLLAEGAAEVIGHEDEAIVERAITALMRSVQH